MSESKPIFAGSILETYHRYLVPLIFEDYARDLATRIAVPADGRVLETACGTGVLTKHLRSMLPGPAWLVATDVNPAMLEIARRELEGIESIEYRTADGTQLPFEDGSFDALACQFGVMFFPERVVGYREAARVLKPGGTFVFNVWDSLAKNPIIKCVHDKVVSSYPEDPPGFLAMPFGYNDLHEIRAELLQAGFADIETHMLPRESRAPSARAVALAVVAGSPLASQLAEKGAVETALEIVEKELIERFGTGEISAPMQSFAIIARTNGGG